MEFDESVALKLISEMKKPGRECMYDMTSSLYKNNHIKQNIWSDIANAIGIERSKCQGLWKTLRRRHKAAINKSLGKSGSKRVEVNRFSQILITEMDYFLNFYKNTETTVTNYTGSNNESFRSIKNEYKESIKTFNTLATTVRQASTEKRDPFFLAMEDEFLKVPDNRKSALKVKLISLIVEHQE